MKGLPLRPVKDGVRLAVRLSPKAAHNRVIGVGSGRDDVPVLKVSVTAIPEKGKANAALIKLLAKSLGLPKSAFLITAGETDRNKKIFIEAESDRVSERLAELLREIK